MRALIFGRLDFLLPGRHLIAGAAINDPNLTGTQPKRRTGDIDGHITAADNRHFLPDVGLAGQIDFSEEFDTLAHAVGLFTGDAQIDTLVRPESQVNRLVSVIQQIFHCQIGSQRCVGFDFHPQVGDDFDLLIEDFPRQSMGRDADSEHTAGFRLRFVNGG